MLLLKRPYSSSPFKELVVGADQSGMRLDRFIRSQHPAVPNSLVQRLVRTNGVFLKDSDGEPIREPLSASYRVKEGSVLHFPKKHAKDIAAPPRKDIQDLAPEDVQMIQKTLLYKDDRVLVINKPAGLATQGGSKVTKHLDGLLAALSFGVAEPPRLVHRLDRETSGCLILARTRTAAHELAQAFKERGNVLKSYWGVTVGVPSGQTRRVSHPIRVGVKGGVERMLLYNPPEGSPEAKAAACISEFAVASVVGDQAAWVVMEAVTGRKHQLRVHAADVLGTPLLGDAKYGRGPVESLHDMVGTDPVLHLHARHVCVFDWHGPGKDLVVKAPLPPHMTNTWSRLGFAHDVASVDTQFGLSLSLKRPRPVPTPVVAPSSFTALKRRVRP